MPIAKEKIDYTLIYSNEGLITKKQKLKEEIDNFVKSVASGSINFSKLTLNYPLHAVMCEYSVANVNNSKETFTFNLDTKAGTDDLFIPSGDNSYWTTIYGPDKKPFLYNCANVAGSLSTTQCTFNENPNLI